MNRWTIQVGVQERQQRHSCGEKKGHVMIKTSEETRRHWDLYLKCQIPQTRSWQ